MATDAEVRRVLKAYSNFPLPLRRPVNFDNTKRLIEGWKRYFSTLQDLAKAELGPRQKLASLCKIEKLLKQLDSHFDSNPAHVNLMLEVVIKQLKGPLGDSLARRATKAREETLQWQARIKDYLPMIEQQLAVLELQVPERPRNAIKLESEMLTLSILHHLAFQGQLGETPPTRDNDPRVEFARLVFDIVEGKQLSRSAVRRRLGLLFETAKERTTRRPAWLTIDRDVKRLAWRSKAEAEFGTDPTVSPEDAKLSAEGLAVDFTVDPAAAARAAMAEWAT